MKKDKNIQEELKEIAPFLASLEKKNNFQVPEGYFEQNPQALIEIIKAEESAKKIAKLAGRKTSMPVPEGYFESLPAAILSNVNSTREVKIISIQRSSTWKQLLQVAAAVAALVIIGLPLLKQQTIKQDSVEVALHKVSDEDLSAYVADHSASFNEDEIAAQVSDSKLEQAAGKINAEGLGEEESLIDVSQIDVNDIQNL